jgi:hypothetical protein
MPKKNIILNANPLFIKIILDNNKTRKRKENKPLKFQPKKPATLLKTTILQGLLPIKRKYI